MGSVSRRLNRYAKKPAVRMIREGREWWWTQNLPGGAMPRHWGKTEAQSNMVLEGRLAKLSREREAASPEESEERLLDALAANHALIKREFLGP